MIHDSSRDALRESAQVIQKLKEDGNIRKAAKVAAFYPITGEPDLRPFLKELAGQNKLLLPRTLDAETMVFYEVRDLDSDLARGRFGIWEPKAELPVWKNEIPVFLVPGRKFSIDGARYGKGKGYYDRFLALHPDSVKIGVAFSSQISEEPLALQAHDIRMNYIVFSKIKE
ncbi:MAG: 5-formyltetrahydrofolate cyclo-ligase [Fibrobacter sp.]|nr:5-formyltetrahydrofolate cyclo-ligase [Fibrobacter sp.]